MGCTFPGGFWCHMPLMGSRPGHLPCAASWSPTTWCEKLGKRPPLSRGLCCLIRASFSLQLGEPTLGPTHGHTCTHMPTQRHMLAHIRAYVHRAHMYTCKCTCMCAHLGPCWHMHSHICTHIDTHMHIHSRSLTTLPGAAPGALAGLEPGELTGSGWEWRTESSMISGCWLRTGGLQAPPGGSGGDRAIGTALWLAGRPVQ